MAFYMKRDVRLLGRLLLLVTDRLAQSSQPFQQTGWGQSWRDNVGLVWWRNWAATQDVLVDQATIKATIRQRNSQS